MPLVLYNILYNTLSPPGWFNSSSRWRGEGKKRRRIKIK
jgi:hypothetical protein